MAYNIEIEKNQIILKAAGLKKIISMDDITSVQSSYNYSQFNTVIYTAFFLLMTYLFDYIIFPIFLVIGVLTLIIARKKVIVLETKGGSKYRCFPKGDEEKVLNAFEEFKSK